DSDLYVALRLKGVTRFRYLAEQTVFALGSVTLEFKAFEGELGWKDNAENGSTESTETFAVEGSTVRLVSPQEGGRVNIGDLTGRGFIDVTWTVDVAGYQLDPASVTDLTPEIKLSGPGLGSIVLDVTQIPVRLDDPSLNDTSYSYRFWTRGKFGAGNVDVEFIDGSWSLIADSHPVPSSTVVTLNSSQWLTVVFDNTPEGFEIDASSVVDAAAEFTFTYSGSGTFSLVPDVTPVQVNQNSFRYRIAGTFKSDGTETVSLAYVPKSWSFASTAVAVAGKQTVDASALALASRSYLDLGFQGSVNTTGGGRYSINENNLPATNKIELTGVGVTGNPITSDTPTILGGGIYRYYLDATKFALSGSGSVSVVVEADSLLDSNGTRNRRSSMAFSVVGTTGSITGPSNSQQVGLVSQNERGFLDVTFGFLEGQTPDLNSIYDLAPEFVINPGAGYNIRLDGSQSPVLISQSGNEFKFRYFTRGSYTSGSVTITRIANTITFTDGTTSSAADTLTVSAPTTANIGYIDIAYTPTTDWVLDADTITDSDAEFEFAGVGLGNVQLSTTHSPIRLTASNTFRYFLTGDFVAGEISVSFLANRFFSVAQDTPGQVDSQDAIGNLSSDATGLVDRFTLATLEATLSEALTSSPQDVDSLNKRGFFDVVLPLNGYPKIDISSVTDLDPEFEVTLGAGHKFSLDATQAPAFLGVVATGYKFRYWYSGSFDAQHVSLELKNSTYIYLDAQDTPVPNSGVVLSAEQKPNFSASATWIDVRFTSLNGVALDANSILDLAPEFALSGTGVGSAELLQIEPVQLSSSSDQRDNDADGQVDEPDENVFRFFVKRGFVPGSVTVMLSGTAWTDIELNPGSESNQGFQVVATVKDSGESEQSDGRVFYMEISGGVKLESFGILDEPLLEIRGGVVLEVGDLKSSDGTVTKRFSLDANGTIKIAKLGNIGSAAARFVFQLKKQAGESGLGKPEFWGVAKVQVNLDFLKNAGIFADGMAMLVINTTTTEKTETIALEGIPGDSLAKDLSLSTGELSGSILGEVPLPTAWDLSSIDSDKKKEGLQPLVPEGGSAIVRTIILGQQWKIVTKKSDGKLGPSYFITKDTKTGSISILSEYQTFVIEPESLTIEVVGSLKIKKNFSSDPAAEDLVRLFGGFYLKITSTRAELFVLAEAEIPAIGMYGSVKGLAILDLKKSADGNRGVALYFELTLSVGGNSPNSDVESPLKGVIEFEGSVVIKMNTTKRDQVFSIPNSFLKYLPPNYPTTLTVYAGAPSIDGTQSEGATPEFYVFVRIAGKLKLMSFSFEGQFAFVVTSSKFELLVGANLSLGPIGMVGASGSLRINSDGLVGRIQLKLEGGELGKSIGLTIT
ncbi:MAG: hypothetical protein ACKOAU_16875, partial [Pirellula sp.]